MSIQDTYSIPVRHWTHFEGWSWNPNEVERCGDGIYFQWIGRGVIHTTDVVVAEQILIVHPQMHVTIECKHNGSEYIEMVEKAPLAYTIRPRNCKDKERYFCRVNKVVRSFDIVDHGIRKVITSALELPVEHQHAIRDFMDQTFTVYTGDWDDVRTTISLYRVGQTRPLTWSRPNGN